MKGKDKFENRKLTIQAIIVLGGLMLIFKIVQLQIIDDTYKNRADAIAIEKRIVYPARGLIYDRKGQLMVNNDALYDLMATYSKVDPNIDKEKFCSLLEITISEFDSLLNKDWSDVRFSKNVPFPFLKKISPEVFIKFQEHSFEFKGFEGVLRSARAYPHQNAANILGYIREVDQKIIEDSDGIYRPGDYIGATGIEKQYEDSLRGRMGISYILKDNLGRDVGRYKDGLLDSIAKSGINLSASIDLELQKFAEELMQNKKGAIVAIEPSTGEILAMVSAPTYDPNVLSFKSNRGLAYGELLRDTMKPLYDRSVLAEYPPGSIFKILVGLAGMEEGVWDHLQGVKCNVGTYVGGRWRGCHVHPHARDMATAIEHSCNSYFFAEMTAILNQKGYTKPAIGLDRFKEIAESFGLNDRLGIDLPSENKGNVPSSDYYNRLYGNGAWRSPFIISIGIGQGEIQMTNLQIANLAAIIANRGHFYRPHLVRGYIDNLGKIDNITYNRREAAVKKLYFEDVVEGMERVVASGTARRAFLPDISICGKTGTSENPHGEDHSVFFGFAPKNNPQIAIAVYVENSGFGGTYAAPIASLIIEKYINGEIRESRLALQEQMKNANLLNVIQKPKRKRTVNASIRDRSDE